MVERVLSEFLTAHSLNSINGDLLVIVVNMREAVNARALFCSIPALYLVSAPVAQPSGQ
eukprot:SAG22_NODE_15630_length_344_cov_1.024490_1_plen_58_part_01